jgi:hypothetical protein
MLRNKKQILKTKFQKGSIGIWNLKFGIYFEFILNLF